MERFVWIACYGMPFNAWQIPTFREIGDLWGQFIEVDENTLKEISYDKGRILIVTEKCTRIGQIQISVGEIQYKVRIEEHESFRTILSSMQPSMQGPQSANEDDDVDYGKDRRDANKAIDSPIRNQQVEKDVQLENKKDDLESDENGDGNLNDLLKDNNLPLRVEELQIINADNNVLLLEEQQYQVPRLGGTLALNGVDGIDGENSNEINGLEFIVEDSDGPISLIRKMQDEVNSGWLIKNTQSIEGQKSKEDDLIVRDTEPVDEELNAFDPISLGSKNNLRASQLKGIDLRVELRPCEKRRIVRSQTYDECLRSLKTMNMRGTETDLQAKDRT